MEEEEIETLTMAVKAKLTSFYIKNPRKDEYPDAKEYIQHRSLKNKRITEKKLIEAINEFGIEEVNKLGPKKLKLYFDLKETNKSVLTGGTSETAKEDYIKEFEEFEKEENVKHKVNTKEEIELRDKFLKHFEEEFTIIEDIIESDDGEEPVSKEEFLEGLELMINGLYDELEKMLPEGKHPRYATEPFRELNELMYHYFGRDRLNEEKAKRSRIKELTKEQINQLSEKEKKQYQAGVITDVYYDLMDKAVRLEKSKKKNEYNLIKGMVESRAKRENLEKELEHILKQIRRKVEKYTEREFKVVGEEEEIEEKADFPIDKEQLFRETINAAEKEMLENKDNNELAKSKFSELIKKLEKIGREHGFNDYMQTEYDELVAEFTLLQDYDFDDLLRQAEESEEKTTGEDTFGMMPEGAKPPPRVSFAPPYTRQLPPQTGFADPLVNQSLRAYEEASRSETLGEIKKDKEKGLVKTSLYERVLNFFGRGEGRKEHESNPELEEKSDIPPRVDSPLTTSGSSSVPPGGAPPPSIGVANMTQGQVPDQSKHVNDTFATGEVKQNYKVYHNFSIKVYFGSDTKPDWDYNLQEIIKKSNLSINQRVMIMDDIINSYGPKIFVDKRLSSSIDELNELIQLQFCVMRNLQRGNRTRQATIPVSELIKFRDDLSGQPQSAQPPGSTATPIIPTFPPQTITPQNVPDQPVIGTTQGQQQISSVQAREKLIDAYEDSAYNYWGKLRLDPRFNNSVSAPRGPFIGSGNQRDPAQLFIRYQVPTEGFDKHTDVRYKKYNKC